MFALFRRTPEQRRAARRHRIWVRMATIARDLNALHRGNTDVLTEREAGKIVAATSLSLAATAMLERNNRS